MIYTLLIELRIVIISVMSFVAYGNLGSILSSQGKIKEAEEALRMALYYRPNMAEVHYNL